MSLILVVEAENHHAEPVIRALTSDKFNVKVVSNHDEALRAAAYEAPSLVLVSSDLPGAAEMMNAFASKRGGPGVVALLRSPEQRPLFEPHADSVLVEPIADEEYRQAVRSELAGSQSTAAAAVTVDAGQKLTSADIFGDVLAEVEEAPIRPTAKISSAELFGDMLAELGGEVLATPATATPAQTPPPPSESTPPPIRTTPPPSEPVLAVPGPPPKIEATPPVATPMATPAIDPPKVKGVAKPTPTAPTRQPPPTQPPPEMDAEIQQKLELTLSGVLGTGTKARKRTGAGDQRAQDSRSEIDALLSSTLSSLNLDSMSTKRRTAAPIRRRHTPADLAAEIDKLRAGPAAESPPAEVAPSEAAEARQIFKPVSAGQEFGQYTLLKKIALGGMAEVWKARMRGVEGFQKTVAIKKILHHLTDNDSFVNMFIDEAKLAAQLSHPNITHIYDLGKLNEDYYIAMEFVEGRNLRAVLTAASNASTRMPVGVVLLVAARLASALDYAHRKRDFDGQQLGLVHRDVSPQNVLLSYEGDIKLCDFGIVKAVSRTQHTQLGALKGKLQYMSPEQARGQSVDARSDLFSLGSLIFEMLVGRRLFPGDNELSVLEAVRECNLPAPIDIDPTIPASVDELVRQALRKDPDDRFQTASEMQQRIESILYSLDPTPSQADLAAFMHQVLSSAPRPAAKPKLEATSAPTPTAPPASPPTTLTETPPPSSQSSPALPSVAAPVVAEVTVEEKVVPDEPAQPTAENLDPVATGEVVEFIQPTENQDPGLVKGPSRGRWWILLLILVLAAVLAWIQLRKAAPRAQPAPGSTAQPAVTQPADPPTSSVSNDTAIDHDANSGGGEDPTSENPDQEPPTRPLINDG